MALFKVLSVVAPDLVPPSRRSAAASDPRGLTMLYRDLVVVLDDLDAGQRLLAEQVLARPDQYRGDRFGYALDQGTPKTACGLHFCMNWIEGTTDSPPPVDSDADGIPDQVEMTAEVFEEVWAVEVDGLGYRPPKPDARGPNALLDVFIEDIGADGAYGACVPEPDDSNTNTGPFDTPGYCIVDNDFSPAQFPTVNGLPALQVTAAHEFFHAIQFGYDYVEDLWLMEGTAAWIEDVVYDEINDNYQYLVTSALARPDLPLDFASFEQQTAYSSWLFWRFLTEAGNGIDPSIIKAVWDRADGSAIGPDDFSLQAVDNVLRAGGSSFGSAFADYTAMNNFPELVYEEGEGYVAAAGHPPIEVLKISLRKPKNGGVATLDHLSSINILLTPAKGVKSRAKLRVKLDLPDAVAGPMATLQVLLATGEIDYVPLTLNGSGDLVFKAAFGKGKVSGLLLTLTNASTRVQNCYQGSRELSCYGEPVDDGAKYNVKATLKQ